MFMRVKTLKENNILFNERYFIYLEDFIGCGNLISFIDF